MTTEEIIANIRKNKILTKEAQIALRQKDIKLFLVSTVTNMFLSLILFGKVHVCYYTGSKRRTMVDKFTDIANICGKLGIIFIIGNDAPRGGRIGCYIELVNKDNITAPTLDELAAAKVHASKHPIYWQAKQQIQNLIGS